MRTVRSLEAYSKAREFVFGTGRAEFCGKRHIIVTGSHQRTKCLGVDGLLASNPDGLYLL